MILTLGQVFHITPHSFALVNIKPLLPGHVLVCPRRPIPRFSDLTQPEVTDLFLTVQRVSRVVEQVYGATGLNIAMQDGADAGQSVPHLHTHIVPRKRAELDDRGGSDAIYSMMDSDDGNVGRHLRDMCDDRPQFPKVDEGARQPRSQEEMAAEARNLAREMEHQ